MHPFEITASDGEARAAVLKLPHGTILTPVFMPVGSQASVKAMRQEDIEQLGYRLLLANAYHLYLRPGVKVVGQFGGLHRFMAWNGNILTDSGGYQIFSLPTFRKVSDEGVRFRSHIDGSSHSFTPEAIVDIQAIFGSDIMMPLDICSPYNISEQETHTALRITGEWAARSARHWHIQRRERPIGSLFGIVQGGFYPALRAEAIAQITQLDLPGYALGGLSVGEPLETFCEMVALCGPELPASRPRYVMGIGTPEYILAAVEAGIDMFDCVYPTRIGRNATVLSRDGLLTFRNLPFAEMDQPIDPHCGCSVCRRYSLGYLRHLYKSGEILAAILATYHNLAFMGEFMQDIRRAIAEGRFASFKRSFLQRYQHGEGVST